MNKLLQRQVQKFFGSTENLPENIAGFLSTISESYDHYEKDRLLLERAIDLTSTEMIGLNDQLRADIRAREKSENRYRIVHETPFLGIALGNMDGIIQNPNKAFCDMLGYSEEELINQHFSMITHEEDLVLEMPFVEKMMAGEIDSYTIEKRYVRKDRTLIWIELNISCAKDAKGEVEYVIAVVKDITRRKEVEKLLEKSEKRFRALVEYGADVVLMIDKDGMLSYVSPSYEKLFGFTPEECIGRPGYDFIHPDDIPVLMSRREQMMREPRTPIPSRQRVVNKQGEYVWCEGVAINLMDTEGVNAIVINFRDITERQQAEEKLELTLNRFKMAQQIAQIGHWELDLRTYVSTWSDEAFRIYGHEPGSIEASYGLFLGHVHPDDQEMVKSITRESMETFSSFSFQHRLIDAKGNHKQVASIGRYEFDASGKATRLFGIAHDVTELKEKEQQLQSTKANLRNLLENTETAYVLLDTNANILTYNSMARELGTIEMGMMLEEGTNYVNLMPPDRKENVHKLIGQVLQTQTKVSYDVKYTHPGTTEYLWLHVSMHPILDSAKNVLGLSVGATNITDRKKTEDLIRQSNERYELVTKATNDVIWDWNIPGNQIFRSENYQQVFGFQENENDIETWLRRIHPDDRRRVSDNVRAKIEAEDSLIWEDEYRYFKSSGEMGYVQDRGYIIHDENGKPLRMVGAMRDITAEKLYAIEREKITSRLIRQNKDLEQFAYIVSHNLRAPVANILGLSKIIPNGDMPDDYRQQCFEGLVLSAQKLDMVITDLNTVLQMRHEISESKEIVSLSALVDDIKTSVSDFIRRENVVIQTDFSPVDEMYTLKSYIYSIIYNLVSNSIKYRNMQERPVIEISSQRVNGTIRLRVRDNGRGIDMEKHGHQLFGLYKRFHANTEGKGMGLFMVKTQVETLGGKISVKSEVNKGTEFLLEFEKQSTPKVN